ncbi:MAG: SipW-dependent-type signal peptide-containing protein [bacterium]|nr:SipW-dependent-type signal peptide-containing protein [bacterium]
MNKKILLSLVVIGLVSSVGIVSTRALFSDSETKSGSAFTIGTLDLDVTGGNGSDGTSISIDNIGATGDLSGERSWVVNNKGSIPGRLYLKMANLVNLENGCNEPEAKVDQTCLDTSEGELGGVLNVKFYIDNAEKVSSKLSVGSDLKIKQAWENLPSVAILPGESLNVKMTWEANPESYGNEIQSDSVSFDIVFDLVQLVNQ